MGTMWCLCDSTPFVDLDVENRERKRLHLFQFSLRNQASNWLERLLAGSISTWEDLTTRFLAQFFPSRRTPKPCNDILMFQQQHGESLSEAWTRFKDLLQKFEIDRVAGDKLRNKNTDESWEIIENLALHDHEGPSLQPQALGTTFEARERDYMAAHTERMERFENTIFKQREEINGRMTKMFGLLKELTTSKTPKKVLIREEAKFPITKNVNSISLTKGEEERSNKAGVTPDNTEKPTKTKMEMPVKEAEKMNEAENEAGNESIKIPENEEAMEASGSQPVGYYLKHKINEKLIKGLVNNNRFNNSLSGTRIGKKKGKAYKVLPGGPVYDEILKKKITKKEDIEGNFEIPCSIEDLKHANAFVDQGSDVNAMPYSTYMKLTDERPAEIDIRISLASHSYIYPLGVAEDVLVEVAEHDLVDFMILDIKENENRPFILGTPFLKTAKASIKFDKGTITLRSGKSKVSFHRIPDSSCVTDKDVKNDIEPITPTMTVNRLVMELYLEKEMKFNQWRSKNFKGKRPTLITTKEGLDDEGEQCEEINGRMTEMFGLLKELTTSRTPEKVLIREEAKFPVTKNVNSISLTKGEEERSNKAGVTPNNTEKPTKIEMEMPVKEAEKINEAENGAGNESIKIPKNEEAMEASGSQPVGYYLKHKINEKLIKGLVNNNRFNNSLSGTRVGKKKGKAYKVLLGGPIYDEILKKKITKKEDIRGNFEIPCSIGDLKHANAFVDQGSDVNVMPYSTYMKLTDERPAEIDIRISLASHSYIYPLGVAEDVLVEVAEHDLVDFMI
ncbi:MAK10-like protein, partial [Tanacetum coccineum]